jgi:hypothetical protein
VHATVLSKDNKTLYVPDLGMDKVMLYNFNNKTGKLTEAGLPYTISEPGAGPRHFDIHPTGKFGYLMEELNGTVNVLRCSKMVVWNLFKLFLPCQEIMMARSAVLISMFLPMENFYTHPIVVKVTQLVFLKSISNQYVGLGGCQSTLGKSPVILILIRPEIFCW